MNNKITNEELISILSICSRPPNKNTKEEADVFIQKTRGMKIALDELERRVNLRAGEITQHPVYASDKVKTAILDPDLEIEVENKDHLFLKNFPEKWHKFIPDWADSRSSIAWSEKNKAYVLSHPENQRRCWNSIQRVWQTITH